MSTTSSNEERASARTIEIAVSANVRAWRVEVQDADGGRVVPLGREPTVVGSSRSAAIVVRDPTVSGRHCEIVSLGAGVMIRDLGSKNGTFVGGARVKEALGGVGTAIVIGQTSLVIVAVSDHGGAVEPGKPLPAMVGESVAMRSIADRVRRLAGLNAPVLVTGETGTGKELVARALHEEGARRAGPFVAVNTAALPRELVESEMFGHERGAFTGAVASRRGAFAAAEGGTLFLDEIGELPLDAQPKLLRALDGYEVRAIGASSGKRADARVVAATHVDLEERVENGAFRRDLFHRLEVYVICLPPLRERRGDIGPIARALLASMAPELGHVTLSPAALARLLTHSWPGNVRELRNVLRRAADVADFSSSIDGPSIDVGIRATRERTEIKLTPGLARALFTEHDRNMSRAARAAGMPRTSFRKLLERHDRDERDARDERNERDDSSGRK